MTGDEIRKLLDQLDTADATDDADSVTRLLKLAVAINQWDYPCVCRVECGYSVQDSGCVGEIKLLLSDSRGTWEVLVRVCDRGDLITFFDPQGVLAKARENELAAVCEEQGYIYVPLRLLQQQSKGEEYPDWWKWKFQ